MSNVGCVAVTDNVGCPFVLGCISVSCADVAGLKCLEILKSAQLIGHGEKRRQKWLT